MQLFYFILKAGRQAIPDTEGQELIDAAAARAHAVAVAQQLMRNRENATRNWRIEVCDDYLCPLFDVAFAEAGDHFEYYPQLRAARMAAGFNRALEDLRATLSEVRKTLSRAQQLLGAVNARMQTHVTAGRHWPKSADEA